MGVMDVEESAGAGTPARPSGSAATKRRSRSQSDKALALKAQPNLAGPAEDNRLGDGRNRHTIIKVRATLV